MYSREEAFRIKQSFWTAYGRYMSPVPSSEGMKINWVNYKTGIKDIHFKLNVDKTTATIGVFLMHDDPGIRDLFFEQFSELKSLLHACLNEQWEWCPEVQDRHGKLYASISKELHQVSIFNQDDWPTIISFFKPRIIALDEFWSNAKYSFDSLK